MIGKSAQVNEMSQKRIPKQLKTDKNLSSNLPKIGNNLNDEKSSTRLNGNPSRTTSKKATSPKLEKQLSFFGGIDVDDLNTDDKVEKAFEKFWTKLTDNIEDEKLNVSPKQTKVDQKIAEIQSRIKLNQIILRNANQRMKDINFDSEKESVKKWKDTMFTIKGNSTKKSQTAEEMKRLHLSKISEIREKEVDREAFIKLSPGIVNFNRTIESTLNMLQRVQSIENGDYTKTFYELQKECESSTLDLANTRIHNEEVNSNLVFKE